VDFAADTFPFTVGKEIRRMRENHLVRTKAIAIVLGLFSFSIFSTTSAVAASSTNVSIPTIGPAQISLPIVHSGESSKYKHIVALANGSAEVIAALGYKANLVGRDIASTMPELSNVPIDNPGMQVSVETILKARPDVIIIDANTSPSSANATLKKSGIKVVSIADSYAMTDILPKEKTLSDLLGVPKAYAALSKAITGISFPKAKAKVAFLYVRGTASIYLIGGTGSGADSLISKMGYTDVGAALYKTPFTDLTSEALITMHPDVIMVMTKGLQSVGGITGLLQLPGVAQTPAGIHKRVVAVDDSLLLSFGPRTAPMLPLLRKAIDTVLTR
jgi:iron complex transport system substrate-binding protein